RWHLRPGRNCKRGPYATSACSLPEDPDSVWSDLPRLLCLGVERRGEKAQEAQSAGAECPPIHYSMTSSALASTDGGIVSPNAFTVFRLITNSNLVGCSARLVTSPRPLAWHHQHIRVLAPFGGQT